MSCNFKGVAPVGKVVLTEVPPSVAKFPLPHHDHGTSAVVG
jgi:hypothetical protein